MKLLYIMLSVFGALFAGYLFINDFTFDNISFSNYLISTLFVLLLCCIGVICLGAMVSFKRKNADKNVMTIRQYYQYKSAR
ncbi:MAG: hypothetical protein V4581_00450 [Bacteroidota bacterium]